MSWQPQSEAEIKTPAPLSSRAGDLISCNPSPGGAAGIMTDGKASGVIPAKAGGCARVPCLAVPDCGLDGLLEDCLYGLQIARRSTRITPAAYVAVGRACFELSSAIKAQGSANAASPRTGALAA